MTARNEAAFPRPYSEQQPGDRMEFMYAQDGMTMREWYAGMAMQGLLQAEHEHNEQGVAGFVEIAEAAFMIADAMLARAKQ